MKQFLVIFLFILTTDLLAQRHLWEQVDVGIPEFARTFERGDILDSSNAVLIDVGSTGCNAYITADAGKSWKTIYNSKTFAIPPAKHGVIGMCVSYPEKDNIFIGGNNGALTKTTDGGLTWIEKNVSKGIDFQMNKISMFNKNVGIALVEITNIQSSNRYKAHAVWVTYDGWETWNKLIAPPLDTSFAVSSSLLRAYSVFIHSLTPETFLCNFVFVDTLDGKRQFTDVLGKTTDKGKTWKMNKNAFPYQIPRKLVKYSTGDIYFSIPKEYYFVDSLVGYSMAIVKDSTQQPFPITIYIAKTTNGGDTWQPLHQNLFRGFEGKKYTDNIGSTDFTMQNDNEIVLILNLPARSYDGGKTWYQDSIKGVLDTILGHYVTSVRGNVNFYLHGNLLENTIYRDTGPLKSTSVEDLKNNKNIFITMSSNSITIHTPNTILAKDIKIYDLVGNNTTFKQEEQQNGKLIISTKELLSGIYFLRVTTQNGVFVKKFERFK